MGQVFPTLTVPPEKRPTMTHDETSGPNHPDFSGVSFPSTRLRRTRRHGWSRALVRENRLSVEDLIWGIILKEGSGVKEPVSSLPGVFRLSPDMALEAAIRAHDLGIPALALFPFTSIEDRTPMGEKALDPDNLMCRTARLIKQTVPEIGLMGDVALDPYTDHGHDGILIDGDIDNDRTTEILVQQSLMQAAAGFDMIAPSDMMDGRIGAIRNALEKAGYINTQIMAYAAKYASAFYGPYRDAIGSSGVLKGDKRTYQMDPGNSDEAMSEIALDLAEGADMIMVKPGMPYLDIVRRAKDTFSRPTFVFQVSGEYASLMAAGQNGWIDGDAAMMEALCSFKRAGADGIITYYAEQAALALKR